MTPSSTSGLAISSELAVTIVGAVALVGNLLFPTSLDKDPSEMGINDDYDEQWDQLYDQNRRDRSSSSDAKKRERREIDNSLGKDRAAREDYSRDLHDAKRGGRNDRNKSFGDLKNKNWWD